MKILIVSPTPTHPCRAGNHARIFNISKILKSLKHEVFFLHIRRERGDINAMSVFWQDHFFQKRYIYPLKPVIFSNFIKRKTFKYFKLKPKPYKIDDWYDNRIDSTVKMLHRKFRFDVVIAEYVFFSRVLENFDNSVLKIIDTHDIFTNRHQAYINMGYMPQWFSTTREQEAKGLDRADVVIAINEVDQERLKRTCSRKVITIGYMSPSCPTETKKESQNRTLLYLGSDNLINIEAINFFLNQVFPLIRKERPDVTLHLVGTIGRAFKNRPGCVAEGEIDSLQKIFSMADIMINPARVATGLSIKSIQTIGHGKILLTTKEGIRGLERAKHSSACIVAKTPEEFANKALSLLDNRKQLRKISENAILFSMKYYENNIKALHSLFG